jgi:hypothetical protein
LFSIGRLQDSQTLRSCSFYDGHSCLIITGMQWGADDGNASGFDSGGDGGIGARIAGGPAPTGIIGAKEPGGDALLPELLAGQRSCRTCREELHCEHGPDAEQHEEYGESPQERSTRTVRFEHKP